MRSVTRAAWGAREPRSVTRLEAAVLEGVAVHYTGMNVDEQVSHANCAARVRAVQAYHMDEQAWADVAYNFMVCKHGYVFTGRGWGVRSAAQGTTEGNDAYHAVCFLGDDTADRDDVTFQGRVALIQLLALAVEKYPKARRFRPHSDFTGTECPGAQLRAWLPWMGALIDKPGGSA